MGVGAVSGTLAGVPARRGADAEGAHLGLAARGGLRRPLCIKSGLVAALGSDQFLAVEVEDVWRYSEGMWIAGLAVD